ncbi:hypothetical protein [Sphingomonas sanguinis]|uniref:Uncharacterized protein n=1 Tax=Sphingomonas sanguinis TaxID=33051 RepID=A0A147INM2_9SPHN|nr:hypothetical protein [Sphingomonas sanguinis]KTT96881.1 hypothetical protein SB4_14345 [Sphingomonas sanguinis]
MTPPLRDNGSPSPFEDGTHDPTGLPPPIAFNQAMADGLRLGGEAGGLDTLDLGPGAPSWMTALARSIRPLCVGALMMIPTAGAASVGLVAMVSPRAAAAMVAASTAFLAGIPTDIVLLIGTLASGYGLAKSVERLRGSK